MLKRVELELHGKKPDEVDELNLDNCKSTQIEGVTDEFVNLKRLSMINVGLQSLKGLPKLPNLERLDLSDNRLSGGLEHLLVAENLTHLKLSGNKISSLDSLEALTSTLNRAENCNDLAFSQHKQMKSLQSLDLFNCEITKTDDYRSKIFDMLPSLVYLDETDRMNRSCVTDEEETDGEENGEENESLDDAEDDDEEGEEYGLEYLQSSKAANDDDEEDFEPDDTAGDDDEDEDIEEEEEDSEAIQDLEKEELSTEGRGKKRKLEEDI